MYKKLKVKMTIYLIVALVTTVGVMLGYRFVQKDIITTQIKQTICQNTSDVVKIIDSKISTAFNSIQVTSVGISKIMTGKELENPQEVIDEFIDNTPFGSIEYIRADGMNTTNAGEPFDASDREYYKKGIMGETGIWINYTPKYSKEPLLNFYTPLYYENEIVGVLTGTLGGNTGIRPLFTVTLYNNIISALLVDKDNRIISSTEDFRVGVSLTEENANVSDNNMNEFMDVMNKADGTVFVLNGPKGMAIGTVAVVPSTGWRMLQIAPADSVNSIMSSSNTIAVVSVVAVLAVSLIIFIFVIYENNRYANYSVAKANEERDEQVELLINISKVYYSMHLMNLKEGTMTEYSASNQIKDELHKDEKFNLAEKMRMVMRATITDEQLEKSMEFTDLDTLSERMKGKNFLTGDFLGKNVGWVRFEFVAVECDKDERPTKVVFITQIIDSEKKEFEELVNKSNTDELTRCYNRRSYVDDMIENEVNASDNIVYVAMDVNGLKAVNDNEGHLAGDELIIGAAECMKNAFAKHGKVYRTGGDEFVAILFADEETTKALIKDFEAKTSAWKGEFVKELSISCGYVMRSEFPEKTLHDISVIADKRMYEAKECYYREKGVDRRGQQTAFKVLNSLYTKILKINLSDDTFNIYNMDNLEKTAVKGYDNSISKWLQEFGNSGQVHPDDLEDYLKKTDTAYLTDYFKKGNKICRITYRRIIDGVFKKSMMQITPAEDYSEDNQVFFLYVIRVEE